MQEHQREEILTHLAEVYALEEKDAATLQDALMAVAREMVNDNLEEYLDGLEYAVEGTYLEDLDEVTIRSDFRQLATDSVYYLLSRRCGLDPMELLEEEDFMHITDYNRLSVLTFLGNAASQLSESILIDVGKTVHKISLEEARKEVEKSNERNYNNFDAISIRISFSPPGSAFTVSYTHLFHWIFQPLFSLLPEKFYVRSFQYQSEYSH